MEYCEKKTLKDIIDAGIEEEEGLSLMFAILKSLSGESDSSEELTM
ncbi:14358_t:CDS:2 [Entrophospora sp. SA101]|nr:14358_t:CDS:2 [Entrophospora sp. SA101]